MKVSREQVAEHRTRILAAAARLFRLRGFDEVTVAEVMKDAGLTHGAFYWVLSIQGGTYCRGGPTGFALGSRRSKAAPAGGGLCRRLSQRQAPRQPRDLLSVLKLGNGSRAGFSRAPTRYDGGRPSPDRSSQC